MMRRAARTIAVLLTAAAAACGDSPGEPRVGATLELTEVLGGQDTMHARAVDPREFVFPADHGEHPEYRTEWWYFTGNLATTDGREFGYQLTFFRSALQDSASFDAAGAAHTSLDGEPSRTSAWRTRHAYMAHFALADISGGQFHAFEQFARPGTGLAGVAAAPFRVWTGSWLAESEGDAMFPLHIVAGSGDVAIDLVLERGKPVVLQGERGLSRKGAEPGNASYYYSLTRMPTRGTIVTGGDSASVTGASWLDREWGTSALAQGLTGWDWMSLQLDDRSELMLYQLRRDDGTVDSFSAGTFIRPDGTTVPLGAQDFTIRPLEHWRASDGVAYPTRWQVSVPALDITLDVEAALPDQELRLAVRYWEGSVRIRGTRGRTPVIGRGYTELTGYDR